MLNLFLGGAFVGAKATEFRWIEVGGVHLHVFSLYPSLLHVIWNKRDALCLAMWPQIAQARRLYLYSEQEQKPEGVFEEDPTSPMWLFIAYSKTVMRSTRSISGIHLPLRHILYQKRNNNKMSIMSMMLVLIAAPTPGKLYFKRSDFLALRYILTNTETR